MLVLVAFFLLIRSFAPFLALRGMMLRDDDEKLNVQGVFCISEKEGEAREKEVFSRTLVHLVQNSTRV